MDTAVIRADFTRATGRPVKPVHSVNNAPILGGEPCVNSRLFHYMKEAAIPLSRLHDTGFLNKFVDICFVFPNFDADENDPASYDFTFTDVLIRELTRFGMEPLFRLGNTIENAAEIKAYHIYPPKDFQKWARVAEHVVRHYNEGWANGFHYGIRYWEIWNEPDSKYDPEYTSETWQGTREQFFEFYKTVSVHLKNCFGDSISVGGYAAIGFKDNKIWDPELKGVAPEDAENGSPWAYRIDHAHKFLAYVRDNSCPLDFFSWHAYNNDIDNLIDRAEYCRRLLDKYGFSHVPHFLDEWNTCVGIAPGETQTRVFSLTVRSEVWTPARTLGVLIALQHSSTALACYYDAVLGSCPYTGLFSSNTLEPYKTYYAFKSFGYAYRLGEEILTETETPGVYVLGAKNGKKGVLLIANTNSQPLALELSCTGAETDSGEVLSTDRQYLYTVRGRVIRDGKLTVKGDSCTEVRFRLKETEGK